MILHPGILALIAGSFVVTTMMLYASFLGFKIIRKWDITSSSVGQLTLERQTYLISTLMNAVFGFEAFSALLFIYTVDDLHHLFVGAMCATGSLNANPIGWWVLYTKIIIFFFAVIWIAFNYIDQRADDYPLVRIKYVMVLFITPVVALDAYLQLKYFLGLRPDIITSCCGALFSQEGGGLASSLATLPIKVMMVVFYGSVLLFLLNAFAVLRFPKTLLRYSLSATSLILFIVALASIVSFISLYFYRIPTHHCPFDILQAGYHFIGFPLYITLFTGSSFGLISGLVEPFHSIPSLHNIIRSVQNKWILLSIALITVFAVIASWPIVFSSFTLEGYW